MIRNLKARENFKIIATDGEIGHVKDFYFEDDDWVVRYLVAETGTRLSSRKVLISVGSRSKRRRPMIRRPTGAVNRN